MTVSLALPVGKKITAENHRSVILKAVAKPWQAARQLLVDRAPAAIAGAAGTDTLLNMQIRVVGYLAQYTLLITHCGL
jgi:hypothetical protein